MKKSIIPILILTLSLASGSWSKAPARNFVNGEPCVRLPKTDTPVWYSSCILPPIPVPEDTQVLALRRTEAKIRVLGPFAEVEVVQHYHNPAKFPVTVGYTFPLPGAAAVREVEMVTGGRTLRAELREIEEARKVYDEAANAGHGAVLVEGIRENVFRARLANILPGQDLAVRIVYSERLALENGGYRLLFPTVVAPRYCPADQADRDLFALPYVPSGLPGHAIDIGVEIHAGGSIREISSPTHPITVRDEDAKDILAYSVTLAKKNEVPNRDFVLTWKLANTELKTSLWVGPRQDEGTPFLLVAYPDRSVETERSPKEIIFILDSSGSMAGEKWVAATRALKGFLRGLSSDDSFRLVEFDDDFTEMADRPLVFSQTALDRADKWIDGLDADGGTEILAPVAHALKLKGDPERERIVVLLTDGQVGNEDEVLAEVNRHLGRGRIFTLGIDYAVNDEMLKAMARVSRGTCTLITPDEDVEGAILALRKRFTSPVLSDLHLDFGSAATYPDPLPDLFADEPLVVLGRLKGASRAHAVLSGKSGKNKWNATVEAIEEKGEFVSLGSVVAEKEIEGLLDKARGDGGTDRVKKDIVARSIRHHIATPFTAFVVVDPRGDATDTSKVRNVEIPVAFPHGWNWDAVMGRGRGSSQGIFFSKSQGGGAGYGGHGRMVAYAPKAMMRMADMSAPMCALPAPSPDASMGYDPSSGAWSGAGAPEASIDGSGSKQRPSQDLLLRYLIRNQRANGLWQSAGRDDLRASALAALALVRQYGTYSVECDRALAALAASDPAKMDAVTRQLAKLVFLEAASTTGRAAYQKSAAALGSLQSVSTAEMQRLANSDDVADLARLVCGIAANPTAGDAARSTAAARLENAVVTSGSEAGAVRLRGQDPIAATAAAAALGN